MECGKGGYVKHPKISVITWDAGFRENFHTIDSFANQTIPKEDYEFIWVDYYDKIKPEVQAKITGIPNAKSLCVNGNGQWRLATCLNYGIKNSSGELLVIPDGDIVVNSDFLSKVWDAHSKIDNLVLYFRRWDEPEHAHSSEISIEHMEKVCEMNNPTNYSGCITMRRHVWDYVNGYEEHPLFAGPSFTGLELYTRLKNAGFPIMWHPTVKIYHPWHANTGTPAQRIEEELGLIRCRDLAINYKASSEQVNMFLREFERSRENIKSSQLIYKIVVLLDMVGLRYPLSKIWCLFRDKVIKGRH